MEDKLNLYRRTESRFCEESGQSSQHGQFLYGIGTQNGQRLSFHASTGQGAAPKGPGSGRAVFYTPGLFQENVGEGLVFRKDDDKTCLPARTIVCDRGDLIIDCKNGDVTIRARNINLDANGGGVAGEIELDANKLVNIKSPDVRVSNCQRLVVSAERVNVVANQRIDFLYGLFTASSFADQKFGALSASIDGTRIKTFRNLGD